MLRASSERVARSIAWWLLVAALAGPVTAANAQPARKTGHVGFLGDGSPATRAADTIGPLRDGLRDLGYLEGKNLTLTVRWSEGRPERLRELAAEFVRLKVDVIVTHGVPGARAAKASTTEIPIVVAVAADMVGTGLVASLPRPGGNVTGISDQVTELSAKEVQLLQELVPRMRSVGVLWNRGNPGAVMTSRATQTAVRDAGLLVKALEVDGPEDLEGALAAAGQERVDAMIIVHDPLTVAHRERIAHLALIRRLPTISASALFAPAGGLMTYGPDQVELFRRAAIFVDKILKGTRPADIPVEQPRKFELVINLKTARALSLTIPPALLPRIDRLIE